MGLDTTWKQILAFAWQAPWLIPYSDAPWLATAAMIVLLIPYFFASWFLEYVIERRMLSKALYSSIHPAVDDPDEYIKRLEIESLFPAVSRAVRNANLVSYGGLAFILILMLVLGPRSGR